MNPAEPTVHECLSGAPGRGVDVVVAPLEK
jgi:hypothetical protein